MAKRFPVNSIHLMKSCRTQKGWQYNLAVEWPDHRWCPCFRILAGLWPPLHHHPQQLKGFILSGSAIAFPLSK